jgi:hypothetical protein
MYAKVYTIQNETFGPFYEFVIGCKCYKCNQNKKI